MSTPELPPTPPPGPSGELDGLDAGRLMDAGMPPCPPSQARTVPWVPPEPEELGRMIPGYQITGLLGRGGMGAVYKGIQASLDREVAIKLLLPELIADPEFEERFRREARSMARLNHPNIVQIYDYGQAANGQHYFIMEFVDGSDLRQLVNAGELDAEGALNAVCQICSALQYAHESGFVHRDIKPANILVNRQGILKVGDFGLAKLIEGHDSPLPESERLSLTGSGVRMGTPAYAAPEQLDGDGHIDHRADLYSLGIMFYEMLTREIPRGAPKPPSTKIAALDVRIDGVVFKAMEPRPDDRYQTALDLRADVDYIRTNPTPSPAAKDSDAQPAFPSPEEIPGGRQTKQSVRSPKGMPSGDAIITTTQKLNSTVLLLGIVALLTLGALAFFLATRKHGDTYNTEQTVTSQEINNSYFTQLISIGVTTAKDLESVVDVRPYGGGFIGISREPVTWPAAQELARRTGAEILPVGEGSAGSEVQLLAWVETSYGPRLAPEAWVTEKGEVRLLRGSDVFPSRNPGTPRKVVLQWGGVKETDRSGIELMEARQGSSPASAKPDAPPAPPTPTSVVGPRAEIKNPLPPSAASTGLLPWKDTAGRVINAEFVRLSGEAAVLRMAGKEYTIPLSRFSPASVEQARKLGAKN